MAAAVGALGPGVVHTAPSNEGRPSLEESRPSVPFMVSINASSLEGSAPLRVSFEAIVLGGNGSAALAWDFADGATASGRFANHTFVSSGEFVVFVIATTTSGAQVNSSVSVHVVPPPSGATGPSTTTQLIEVGVPIGVAIAAGAVILLLRRTRQPPKEPPAGVYGGFPEAPETMDHGDGSSTDTGFSADSESSGPVSPATPARTPTEPSVARLPRGDPRQISREVVSFLYRLGRVPADDIPTSDWTQLGMSRALVIPQNALTNVLRRLEAAGAVTSRLEHVHGRPRRVKTYYLTASGERLAHALGRSKGP